MFRQVLGRDKDFLVATEFFGSVLRQGSPALRPDFSIFIECPCHDIVLPCCDNVLLLCHDNVATEVSLLQP